MDYFKLFRIRTRALLEFYSREEKTLLVSFCVMVLLTLSFLSFWSVPNNFEKTSTIRIEKGSGLSTTANLLENENYIRSAFWFKVFVVLSGGSHTIIAGDYYFTHGENIFDVLSRVTSGDYQLIATKITIPEGLSVFQVADILKSKLTLFDAKKFVMEAPEGYLFPDTYFFLPNATPETVITRMKENFEAKIAPLLPEIVSSGRSVEETITMASIIEEETKKDSDRPIVSGVLWKRISIGMPLQVDATFSYVNGKQTYTLTKADLFDESPYNTYRNKGLPPTPIASPGIESIIAAIHPAQTNYLYFLSDLKGNMYYAKDFAGHQKNRELYLRK